MIEKCNKINCKSIEDSCVSDGPCNEHLTVYEECKSLKSKKEPMRQSRDKLQFIER